MIRWITRLNWIMEYILSSLREGNHSSMILMEPHSYLLSNKKSNKNMVNSVASNNTCFRVQLTNQSKNKKKLLEGSEQERIWNKYWLYKSSSKWQKKTSAPTILIKEGLCLHVKTKFCRISRMWEIILWKCKVILKTELYFWNF